MTPATLPLPVQTFGLRGDHAAGVRAFAVLYMNQPLKLDYLWAALCLLAAVHFIFRA